MSTEVGISLTVNGERISRRVEARRHLIDFLRLDLGLMGSHTGCEHGVCGACTVRVNGLIARGCLVLAASLDGATVETIEGLSDTGEIRDLQDAFVARNACQCGYCTPGMLVTAAELLRDATKTRTVPSRAAIREHLSGNYCRCTGYHAIVDAIETVARARADGAGSGTGKP
jgi:aerobic-type carbon monoxide dehydrogenase small subunit (CoxS/CutS family)